jgi:two-component system, chemotaxis family, chemotaxis protein CheY
MSSCVPPSNPLSILLVEDDDRLRNMLKHLFDRTSHRVVFTDGVPDARAKLQAQHFDVLVTDMLLGDEDGTELILAARNAFPSLRVVAMSGGGNYLRPSFCLSLAVGFGAIAALVKPFTFDELLSAIEGTALPDHRAVKA